MNAYWDSYVGTWIMVWPDGAEVALCAPDDADDDLQAYDMQDEEEFLYDE